MKQRIITAIIALIVVIPFLIYGRWPFVLFGFLLATIGLYELIAMRKLSQFAIPGIFAVLLLWTILARFDGDVVPYISMSKLEGAGLFILLLLAYTVFSKNKFTFEDAGFLAVSAFYVGMGFYYLIEARLYGLDYLLFIFFIIWATDSGAYFVGRSLGKRKLWPVISPNKTIEGAIGGIVIALIVAVVFQLVHPFDYSIISIIFIALLISVAGQVGDLVESAFKRHYGVKDSGKLLPGHGGILDRLDSMIFVLPFLHFIHFIH
ncbi:phosphatidate cytidylyltransferase [Aciduricibacillus chroicocephali]|uniref:Phosphatidate cytidylyltransferase n=1 Tax=Aciduricibacillus chroicocephali TaxID=3054939 RepID=A0ABY9KYE4_9BACI|nr:phosphatidate cytidylyltransferase [Bacillaceae bacterium 44XB]